MANVLYILSAPSLPAPRPHPAVGMIGRRCPDCMAWVALGHVHACLRAA